MPAIGGPEAQTPDSATRFTAALNRRRGKTGLIGNPESISALTLITPGSIWLVSTVPRSEIGLGGSFGGTLANVATWYHRLAEFPLALLVANQFLEPSCSESSHHVIDAISYQISFWGYTCPLFSSAKYVWTANANIAASRSSEAPLLSC